MKRNGKKTTKNKQANNKKTTDGVPLFLLLNRKCLDVADFQKTIT